MLPIMGFFFVLMLVGAFGSVPTIVDKNAAKKAPIPFAMFFSGFSVYILCFLGGYLGSYVGPSFGDMMFSVGLLVGSIGGAIFGYQLGLKRRASVIN